MTLSTIEVLHQRLLRWEGSSGLLTAVRNMLGEDETWPEHGNAPLAIASLLALWNEDRAVASVALQTAREEQDAYFQRSELAEQAALEAYSLANERAEGLRLAIQHAGDLNRDLQVAEAREQIANDARDVEAQRVLWWRNRWDAEQALRTWAEAEVTALERWALDQTNVAGQWHRWAEELQATANSSTEEARYLETKYDALLDRAEAEEKQEQEESFSNLERRAHGPYSKQEDPNSTVSVQKEYDALPNWRLRAKKAEDRTFTVLQALQLAHDKMDDLNVEGPPKDDTVRVLCHWCGALEYSSEDGIIHTAKCPMLTIRVALVTLPKEAKE